MVRELRIQHLPARLAAADQIPADFEPRPIGPRAEVVAAILRVWPDADVGDPARFLIEGPKCTVELELGPEDPCTGLTVRLDDGRSGPFIVHDLLTELGQQALDPSASNGLFALPEDSLEGLAEWRKHREKLVKSGR
jgi:hypothetical protein